MDISKFKKVGRFFQIFVAFSEYLNFNVSYSIQLYCIISIFKTRALHITNNDSFSFLISEARLVENGHEYHTHYSSMSIFSTEHFLVFKTHFGLPLSASFHLVVAFISDEWLLQLIFITCQMTAGVEWIRGIISID